MDMVHAGKERIRLIRSTLRSLRDDERREAYEVARQVLAGPFVDESSYPEISKVKEEPSEYPAVVLLIVVALAFAVLIAAFLPSGYRLFLAGHDVFCESWIEFSEDPTPPEWLCTSVGFSAVALAELGQTVALLSIAVLGTTSIQINTPDLMKEKHLKATLISNRIFWGVAILTTIVAYVGNLHVAKPWEHASEFYGLFAWILDIFPPTIVIGIMYSLKELVLYYIRRNFKRNLLISEARNLRREQINQDILLRQKKLDDPEVYPQWPRLYSIALRDALINANERQKGERKSKGLEERLHLLKHLSSAEWKYLIKQEMNAEDVTVHADEELIMEKIERLWEQQQEKLNSAAETIASEGVKEELVEEAVEEVVKEERGDIWQEADGTWSFQSKYTDNIWNGFKTEKEAEQKRYRVYYSYKRSQEKKD